MKPLGAAVIALFASAVAASAQPVLQNAQVTNATVSGSLDATVASIVQSAAQPAWIGWEAAAVRRERGEHWCWSDGQMVQSNRLEPRDTFFVFLRIEDRRIERVRMFNQDCPIDAGNRPVTWLRDVKAEESVSFLATLAERQDSADARHRVAKGALAALSQHAGPAAVQPLIRIARRSTESRVRGEALFWLAQRAGNEAAGVITDAIANDPETEVKKRAVFALSQLPASEGVPKLIEVARQNTNPVVRKQAMFWLGQSKDPRALAFFEEILK